MQHIWGLGVLQRRTNHQRASLWLPRTRILSQIKVESWYRYKCSEHGCNEEYIGESARNFAERFKEHQKAPSPIFDHSYITGHNININNFTIVGREDQNLTRAIKEALFIRVNDPSLNRNIGKYYLPHIWDEVLHTTSELKLKN